MLAADQRDGVFSALLVNAYGLGLGLTAILPVLGRTTSKPARWSSLVVQNARFP